MKDADAPKVDAAGAPDRRRRADHRLRPALPAGVGLARRCMCAPTPPTPDPDDQTIPDMDTSPDRVRLLRMERLAPAVLFVLFDGVPAVVHIEEPRVGHPVRRAPRPDGRPGAADRGRHACAMSCTPTTARSRSAARTSTVPVPFRAGSPGVINMKKLNEALQAVPGANMDRSVTPAEFAMQMLRFPLRQVFGDTSVAPGAGRVRRDREDRRADASVSSSPPRYWTHDAMTQCRPTVRKAALTPRWAALTQLGGVAADLHNYDRFLVREPRLLVPIDVQAFVVRAGVNDTEPMLAAAVPRRNDEPAAGRARRSRRAAAARRAPAVVGARRARPRHRSSTTRRHPDDATRRRLRPAGAARPLGRAAAGRPRGCDRPRR